VIGSVSRGVWGVPHPDLGHGALNGVGRSLNAGVLDVVVKTERRERKRSPSNRSVMLALAA
jgi:hypothetical protein